MQTPALCGSGSLQLSKECFFECVLRYRLAREPQEILLTGGGI